MKKRKAISVEYVTKIYRVPSLLPWRSARKTHALNRVSFSCLEGEISCLLGPNGAGKTTILKILAGLVLPDSGDARSFDTSLLRSGLRFRSRIGLASPNERSFYWRLTGRQNLDFYASLYGLEGRKKKARVDEVLSVVSLENEADTPYRMYSTGMKQKLLLARALIGRPDIVLLDEPTTHLDPTAKSGMHRFIKEYLVEGKGATVLLCTNDLSEAEKLADHLILLNRGEVLAQGSLGSLRKTVRPRVDFVMQFSTLPEEGWTDDLPSENVVRSDKTLELRVHQEADIPRIVKTAVSRGGELLSCRLREEPLEDIFERLTGRGKE